MVDPFSVGFLVAVLLKFFKLATSWLKNRNKPQWKRDNRLLKIVRDYFKDEHVKGYPIQHEVSTIINLLQQRKSDEWDSVPRARDIERQARAEVTREQEEDDDENDNGYYTDVPPDSDEDEYDDEYDNDVDYD